MVWVDVLEKVFRVSAKSLAEEVLNLVDCLVAILKEIDCYVVWFEDNDGKYYMVVPVGGSVTIREYGKVIGGTFSLRSTADGYVRGMHVGLTIDSGDAGIVRIDGDVACENGSCEITYSNDLLDVDYSYRVGESEWESLVKQYYEERWSEKTDDNNV